MSPLAMLLRVLLCIALILNGSVPVVHAAMALEPAPAASGMDHAAGETNQPDVGGCHDAAPIDAAPIDRAPPTQAPAPLPADDHDCCGDDGDCSSTCAQHCAVSMPAVARLHLDFVPATGPLPMVAATQPDPHLRDRIRPPIA